MVWHRVNYMLFFDALLNVIRTIRHHVRWKSNNRLKFLPKFSIDYYSLTWRDGTLFESHLAKHQRITYNWHDVIHNDTCYQLLYDISVNFFFSHLTIFFVETLPDALETRGKNWNVFLKLFETFSAGKERVLTGRGQ